jgi:hypothetical protein
VLSWSHYYPGRRQETATDRRLNAQVRNRVRSQVGRGDPAQVSYACDAVTCVQEQAMAGLARLSGIDYLPARDFSHV